MRLLRAALAVIGWAILILVFGLDWFGVYDIGLGPK